jgi:hypothetical protein
MSVVNNINTAPIDGNERPRTPVALQTVQVFRVGPEPQVKGKK